MTTDRTNEPSQDARGTARHPDTSSNPDLGELVALLREHVRYRYMPKLCRLTMGKAADALESAKARAEALEKERESARKDRDAAETCWAEAIAETDRVRNHYVEKLLKAEAEVAGLKQRVAEVLEPFANYADHRRLVPGEFTITKGSDLAKRQLKMGDCYFAAELHATVSGEQEHAR